MGTVAAKPEFPERTALARDAELNCRRRAATLGPDANTGRALLSPTGDVLPIRAWVGWVKRRRAARPFRDPSTSGQGGVQPIPMVACGYQQLLTEADVYAQNIHFRRFLRA